MALTIPFFTEHISGRDRAFFIRQLALLLQSGVSLAESLNLVSDQTSNVALRRVIRVLTLDVQNGHPFSQAVSRYPEIFDPVMIAMMKSGEASGQLQNILAQLAEQMESQQAFGAKVRTALLYPVFVLGVMMVVGVILTTVIIPKLKDVFEDVNFALPLTTRLVLGLSDFLINYWYIVVFVLVIFGYVVRTLFTTPGGRQILVRVQERTPVVKGLVVNSQLVRFTRLLAMLLKAGVPISEAIGIVSQSTENPSWNEALRIVRSEVEKGVPLSVALARHRYFPKPLTEMISVGEQSGQMDATLSNMASFYEQQTDAAIKALTALLEPLILVIVAVGVGVLVVSVIMPIYNLAELQ